MQLPTVVHLGLDPSDAKWALRRCGACDHRHLPSEGMPRQVRHLPDDPSHQVPCHLDGLRSQAGRPSDAHTVEVRSACRDVADSPVGAFQEGGNQEAAREHRAAAPEAADAGYGADGHTSQEAARHSPGADPAAMAPKAVVGRNRPKAVAHHLVERGQVATVSALAPQARVPILADRCPRYGVTFHALGLRRRFDLRALSLCLHLQCAFASGPDRDYRKLYPPRANPPD